MTQAPQSDRSLTRWVCPPPAPHSPEWAKGLESLRAPYKLQSRAYSRLPAAFGLEIKAAYVAIQPATDLPEADNSYWRTKCQAVFTRPAIEPIIASFLEQENRAPMDRERALRTASVLAGYPIQYRKRAGTGRSMHGDIEFEPPASARQWLSDVLEVRQRENPVQNKAVYAFARTIMAHPFSDGNGRFARLLFATQLPEDLDLEVFPYLPLAPSFYRHAERVAAAISTLSQAGDWAPLNSVMVSIVTDALSLGARHL